MARLGASPRSCSRAIRTRDDRAAAGARRHDRRARPLGEHLVRHVLAHRRHARPALARSSGSSGSSSSPTRRTRRCRRARPPPTSRRSSATSRCRSSAGRASRRRSRRTRGRSRFSGGTRSPPGSSSRTRSRVAWPAAGRRSCSSATSTTTRRPDAARLGPARLPARPHPGADRRAESRRPPTSRSSARSLSPAPPSSRAPTLGEAAPHHTHAVPVGARASCSLAVRRARARAALGAAPRLGRDVTSRLLARGGAARARGAVAVLLAADVRSWRSRCGRRRVYAARRRARRGRRTRSSAASPRRLLGTRDDVTLRRALQLYERRGGDPSAARQRDSGPDDARSRAGRARGCGRAAATRGARRRRARCSASSRSASTASGGAQNQVDSAIADFTDAVRADDHERRGEVRSRAPAAARRRRSGTRPGQGPAAGSAAAASRRRRRHAGERVLMRCSRPALTLLSPRSAAVGVPASVLSIAAIARAPARRQRPACARPAAAATAPGARPRRPSSRPFVALLGARRRAARAHARPPRAGATRRAGRSSCSTPRARWRRRPTLRSPTRLDRAAAAAERLRAAIPSVAVRRRRRSPTACCPTLLPVADAAGFDAGASAQRCRDREPAAAATSVRATTYDALAQIPGGGYFDPQARSRIVVLLTDGESNPVQTGELAAALAGQPGLPLRVRPLLARRRVGLRRRRPARGGLPARPVAAAPSSTTLAVGARRPARSTRTTLGAAARASAAARRHAARRRSAGRRCARRRRSLRTRAASALAGRSPRCSCVRRGSQRTIDVVK